MTPGQNIIRVKILSDTVLIYLKLESTTLAYHLLITYFTGKRLGQIYHARLRIKCSSLRHHLFSINIIECPTCICGSVEDTHHYLLVCNQYTNMGRELLATASGICNPTLNVPLYGNSSLSVEQNKYIVKPVHDFILKSKRFQ